MHTHMYLHECTHTHTRKPRHKERRQRCAPPDDKTVGHGERVAGHALAEKKSHLEKPNPLLPLVVMKSPATFAMSVAQVWQP